MLRKCSQKKNKNRKIINQIKKVSVSRQKKVGADTFFVEKTEQEKRRRKKNRDLFKSF